MTKEKKKSPPKRWPEKYSIKATIWTPNGAALEFETDLSESRAETIVQELTKQITEPE